MPGKRRRARDANDYYRTPPADVREMLGLWSPKGEITSILEPAAGDGAMLDPLQERWPGAELVAFDVSPQVDLRIQQQTFFMEDASRKYDLVFGNPPYRHAQRFAQQGMQLLNRHGYLVLLLRINFLASKKRRAFWRERLPIDIWALSHRPSFTQIREGPKETDFSDYAWFIWQQGRKPKFARLRVIP